MAGKNFDRPSGGYELIVRYLAEFANHYWALQLAASPVLAGGGTKHILHCDAVKKDAARTVKGVEVRSLNAACQPQAAGSIKGKDTLLLVGPGGNEQWRRAVSLSTDGGGVIALNGLFSDSYGLGGPLTDEGFEPVYYLKRISKGYVFRAYPGGWQAYLETPTGAVELLKDYGQVRPRLGDVAKFVRETSMNKYSIYNDRYAKGFGERL